MTENPHHARRWAILAILGIAQLMVVLDATIVNIALPSAQKALHFSNDNRQWIVTAYSLAFGSLLLLGGKLSDLFGRKWTFIVGLVGFATASAIGGASQSFAMLTAARTLQGAFGALLAPAALSLLTTTFTETSERNKAFGVFGAIAGSGASVGLLLGGILTQYLSWRFCMYVNVVFAVVAISGAAALLHNQAPAVKPKIDIPGALTVFGGLFALVYGFNHAETTSWGNPLTLAMLAAGVVLLAVFVAIERRVRNPLLPLRVVRDRNRGASYLSVGLAFAAMFGVFLFLTYYLQQTRGYSPVETGLAFLPLTAVVMVTAITATTRLRGRFGPRALVVVGLLCGAGAMLILTGLGRQLELRDRDPAGAGADGHRPRARVCDLDQQRHPGCRAQRRGRRLGDRQRLAADRRLARHGAAVDDRRQRGDRLPDRRLAAHTGADRAGGRARLHHRIRGLGRHLRRRGADRRAAVRGPVGPAGGGRRAGPRRLTLSPRPRAIRGRPGLRVRAGRVSWKIARALRVFHVCRACAAFCGKSHRRRAIFHVLRLSAAAAVGGREPGARGRHGGWAGVTHSQPSRGLTSAA